MIRRLALGSLTSTFLLLAATAAAQDASTPGATSSPYPTFTNLSIEWQLSCDDNANGVVGVRYRKQGDANWSTGLPLRRVPGGSNEGHSWSNKHAGSVFGLEPATSYDIELTLDDPDGGSSTEIVAATTRAFPVEDPNGAQVAVTPGTIDAALSSASPGDVLLLADGTYAEINVPGDGTETQPIVLKAENPGGALVAGDVRIDGRSDVHIVGLHVQGQIKFNNAFRIVVRGCTIDTAADGIVSYANGTEGAYIVDNTITGATQWNEAALGASGNNIGEGIVLTGPGNVIAFNRVVGFRDCISLLEDAGAVNQVSIDIYGNDLDQCADDGIEADFAMGNVRVYQNRLNNCFMGLSSQPSLGGPTYFIRNVMFNVVLQAFKLQRSSVGDVGYHNTVVKSGDAFSVNTGDVWSQALFRNNLFIGGPGGTYNGFNTGPGRVMHLPTADGTCHFDFDGYGSIGSGTFSGDVNGVSFDGLAEMQSLTTEANAVQLDLSAFDEAIVFPSDPIAVATHPPLTLAGSSAALDVGEILPNVNDGFGAAGPDLGAYELGQPLPEYGPGGTLGGGGSSSSGTGGSTSSGVGGSTSSGSGGASSSGSGGASSSGSGANTAGSGDSGDDGGCDCRAAAPSRTSGAAAALILLLGLAGARRRSRLS